jgi:hypothetical protein
LPFSPFLPYSIVLPPQGTLSPVSPLAYGI